MKHWLAVAAIVAWSSLAYALSPYVEAPKVPATDVRAVMSEVEKKLGAAGFEVIGRYRPKGLPQYGVVVATDAALLDAVTAIGGAAIAAAPIRVGVRGEGTVFYENPEYWSRAYLRGNYDRADAAVRNVAEGKAP
jgi:hypothetical protein